MKAVEASGLTKSYGGCLALDGLSLSVEEGEIFGFLGPNGAGKTTTIRILTGLLAPTGGRARVAGMDVSENPKAVKRVVGALPESQGYYGWMTGEEYLAYFGKLYAVTDPPSSTPSPTLHRGHAPYSRRSGWPRGDERR
jgi:ABC-2 type transport system ATP-binding protein